MRQQISGTQQHGCFSAGWVLDKRDALSGMTNFPLSASPALRRDEANAPHSPRSRPKRGAQGAEPPAAGSAPSPRETPASAGDAMLMAIDAALCRAPKAA